MNKEQRQKSLRQALRRLKQQIERGEIDKPKEREQQIKRAYGEEDKREQNEE